MVDKKYEGMLEECDEATDTYSGVPEPWSDCDPLAELDKAKVVAEIEESRKRENAVMEMELQAQLEKVLEECDEATDTYYSGVPVDWSDCDPLAELEKVRAEIEEAELRQREKFEPDYIDAEFWTRKVSNDIGWFLEDITGNRYDDFDGIEKVRKFLEIYEENKEKLEEAGKDRIRKLADYINILPDEDKAMLKKFLENA